jgi:uncharacterized protein YecE (DUF72 family)
MHFFVGTSGYSYKEWKGKFYPEGLPQQEMLSHYARHFSTVEINSTFYRMPRAGAFRAWARQVPDDFRFTFKAPQTVTHRKRLKKVGRETKSFQRAVAKLKGRPSPLLFQLPPNFKKDLPRLEAFLDLISNKTRAAFEFRHASWFDDEVFDMLRRKSVVLCIADMDDLPPPPVVGTAGWGYVRLRRKRYTRKQLHEWIEKFKLQNWSEAYVFFKHEETGTGPRFATRFLELAGAQSNSTQ